MKRGEALLHTGSQPVTRKVKPTQPVSDIFRREEIVSRLDFFKPAELLICKAVGLKNEKQRRSAVGNGGDVLFFMAGVKRSAAPFVRGAGDEIPGAGQGRQVLVRVQGRNVLLRVEGGKPRPAGLLFTAARTGYSLPKMSHKNSGF